MSKPKQKAPFATVSRIPVVKIGAPEWLRIERAYGHPLPIDLRTEIVADTQFFISLAAYEYAAPPVDAAVKRIKRLRRFAQELLCLLDSKMLSSLRGSAALHADELIAWHLYQVVLRPSQWHQYLAPFTKTSIRGSLCTGNGRNRREARLLAGWGCLGQLGSSGDGGRS